jgi:chemotaxis protein MotB
MNSGRRHTAAGYRSNPSAWMMTFSDLLMLLFTFFVMLLTMSSMDKKRLKEVFVHLKEAAGALELAGTRGITDLANFVNKYSETETSYVVDENILRDLFIPLMKPDDKIGMRMRDLSELADITDDERGIVLSFQENILFDPGEASIKEEAYTVLDAVAEAIESCPNQILIMGHTDNIPIHTRFFKSNWELSSYRGLSVLAYFLEVKRLEPSRFSVGGYGPSRPLHPNDTPRNRSLNRRVEIIFRHLQGV